MKHVPCIRFTSVRWALVCKHRTCSGRVEGWRSRRGGGRFCRLCHDEKLCAEFSFAGNLLLSYVLRLRLPLRRKRRVYYWLMRCVAVPRLLRGLLRVYVRPDEHSINSSKHRWMLCYTIPALSALSFLFGRKLLHKLLYMRFLFSNFDWVPFTVYKKYLF